MSIMKDGMPAVTDFTKNGHCSGCGGCCSSILPVTKAEMKAMREYADAHGIKPRLPRKKTVVYMRCPYLSDKNKCMIYDARPAICRAFLCNQTAEQTLLATVKQSPASTVPVWPTNIWEIYGMTGMRINGHDVKPDEAPSVTLGLEDGSKIRLQVGKPIQPIMENGQHWAIGLCVNVSEHGIQFANEIAGVRTLRYEDIKTIRTG